MTFWVDFMPVLLSNQSFVVTQSGFLVRRVTQSAFIDGDYYPFLCSNEKNERAE